MKSELFIILNKMNNIIKANTVNIQQIIEKLMYIVYNTQSDIVFVIECLS